MENIDIELFSELMSLDGKYAAMSIQFVSGGAVYRIDKIADMSFDLEGGVPSFNEVNCQCILYKNGVIEKQCSVDAMISYVKKNYFAEDGLCVTGIEDCNTIEEFKSCAEFKHYSMAQLLEKYSGCDEFSLTGFYNGGEDEQHPSGIYRLDKKIGENALKLIKFEQRDLCRYFYEMANKDSADVVPFDTLFAEITAEVEELYASTQERPLDVSAMYRDGKLKQKGENHEVQMIYNSASFLQSCKEDVSAQYENTLTRPIAFEFKNQPLSDIRPCLTRVLVTYCWHSTISKKLGKVFFIKLNDDTKKWLLQFADDYDVAKTGLFDLAFYKDGSCLFSSCTSEKTHTDYSDK